MTLTCPNCGEQIAAENINVQKMIAVCHACDSVFSFDSPDGDGVKAKRRKVKKPQHLTLYENDSNLHMAFRTNWRLEHDGAFIATGIIGTSLVGTLLSYISRVQTGTETALPIAGLIVLTLLAYYIMALIVYNATHIEMDDTSIKVSRKPLPGLATLNQANLNEVSLSGVTDFQCEETEISKREQYDTPRYRVQANLADGNRRMIITDVTEEYAYFITQQLEAHLHEEPEIDTSHLTYADTNSVEIVDFAEDVQVGQLNTRQ